MLVHFDTLDAKLGSLVGCRRCQAPLSALSYFLSRLSGSSRVAEKCLPMLLEHGALNLQKNEEPS